MSMAYDTKLACRNANSEQDLTMPEMVLNGKCVLYLTIIGSHYVCHAWHSIRSLTFTVGLLAGIVLHPKGSTGKLKSKSYVTYKLQLTWHFGMKTLNLKWT